MKNTIRLFCCAIVCIVILFAAGCDEINIYEGPHRVLTKEESVDALPAQPETKVITSEDAEDSPGNTENEEN